MMERYGLEKFLKVSNAVPISKGKLGVLYNIRFERRMPSGTWWQVESREWMRFVLVKNSTPEPDGSFKNYVLQVPHTITKADEAVAWTFGFHSARKYMDALQMES